MKHKILAVSSGGGHWEQLMILSASFAGHDVVYANTLPGLAERSGIMNARFIRDCNQNEFWNSLMCALEVLRLVAKVRPNFVISTGALPGLLALAFGKLMGARVIWVDSVANSEQLSMCGRFASSFADLHLTQWEHLASGDRPAYLGSVL